MSEFQTVMKHKQRMCRSYPLCEDCPLKDLEYCSKNCGEKIEFNYEMLERVIMAWAAKHPELVYPTWTEYFRMIGVFPSWSGHEILDNTRIHAETAKKLGLKPKEVQP